MNLLAIVSLLSTLVFGAPEQAQVEEAPQNYFSNLLQSSDEPRDKILPMAASISNEPIRVQVEGTSIDLPIKKASVNGNDYEFFKGTVSFLETSATPGEGGNIVLYAHNEDELLKPLQELELGNQVIIKTKSGEYRYIVREKKLADPEDIEEFEPTNFEQVTLLTCFGKNRKYRLLVKAQPIGYREYLANFGELLSNLILSATN